MNKVDIIKEVSRNTDVPEATVRIVFNAIVDSIQFNLIKGVNVKIKNFINFSLKVQREVTRKNPMTGEDIIAPTHYKVIVSLPKVFRDKLKKKIVY